jgi:hypothetical protein
VKLVRGAGEDPSAFSEEKPPKAETSLGVVLFKLHTILCLIVIGIAAGLEYGLITPSGVYFLVMGLLMGLFVNYLTEIIAIIARYRALARSE